MSVWSQLPRPPRLAARATLLMACSLGVGCFGEPALPKVKKVVELPEQFEQQQAAGTLEAKPLERWCSDFGDEQLESLVQRAFGGNLNLRVAWVRLRQSQILERQTSSNLYPTLDLQAQAGRQRNALQGPQAALLPDPTFTINTYQTSLAAGYEVDLWGRLAAQRQASALDALATRADVESIAISLTSEVAEAWFDVVHQRQKKALLEAQLEINSRYVELLMLRLSNGSASALDINQQEQQIESLRGQLATIEATEQRALVRLTTLMGKAPGKLDVEVTRAELPAMPAMPSVGVPAQLLERRPDLRAAQLRLEATNKRIAVAVRSRLPTLRLSASLFFQGTALTELLDNLLYNAAAAAAAPLVDGGRRVAEVELAEARQDEALHSYANTLLTALSDVEGAMIQETQQDKLLKQLELNQEKAREALSLAQSRYQQGATDYLRVLTAIQSLQNIEQSVLDAKRRQLSNRVQLCRALGGSWTQELKAPPLSEDKKP